jgi:hypothetical protein
LNENIPFKDWKVGALEQMVQRTVNQEGKEVYGAALVHVLQKSYDIPNSEDGAL